MQEDIVKISQFLDNYLDLRSYKDHSWNGLQVQANESVQKIATAVDSGVEVIEKAHQVNADMLLVHHGLFWTGTNPSIKGYTKKRIDLLYEYGISLYCSHLPLDAHPEVGNNKKLIDLIGAEQIGEFFTPAGNSKPIGAIAEFTEPQSFSSIEETLNRGLPTYCHGLKFGRDEIYRIATCSGSPGYSAFFEILEMNNIDLYITGENSDYYQTAKDAEINVLFAGHNASETLGIKSLGEKISSEFDIDSEFIVAATGL